MRIPPSALTVHATYDVCALNQPRQVGQHCPLNPLLPGAVCHGLPILLTRRRCRLGRVHTLGTSGLSQRSGTWLHRTRFGVRVVKG